jgi:hypothetical protein
MIINGNDGNALGWITTGSLNTHIVCLTFKTLQKIRASRKNHKQGNDNPEKPVSPPEHSLCHTPLLSFIGALKDL